jgi:hypothetical protein
MVKPLMSAHASSNKVTARQTYPPSSGRARRFHSRRWPPWPRRCPTHWFGCCSPGAVPGQVCRLLCCDITPQPRPSTIEQTLTEIPLYCNTSSSTTAASEDPTDWPRRWRCLRRRWRDDGREARPGWHQRAVVSHDGPLAGRLRRRRRYRAAGPHNLSGRRRRRRQPLGQQQQRRRWQCDGTAPPLLALAQRLCHRRGGHPASPRAAVARLRWAAPPRSDREWHSALADCSGCCQRLAARSRRRGEQRAEW